MIVSWNGGAPLSRRTLPRPQLPRQVAGRRSTEAAPQPGESPVHSSGADLQFPRHRHDIGAVSHKLRQALVLWAKRRGVTRPLQHLLNLMLIELYQMTSPRSTAPLLGDFRAWDEDPGRRGGAP